MRYPQSRTIVCSFVRNLYICAYDFVLEIILETVTEMLKNKRESLLTEPSRVLKSVKWNEKKIKNKSRISKNAAQFHFRNFIMILKYSHSRAFVNTSYDDGSSETEIRRLRLLILFVNLNITKRVTNLKIF